MANFGRAGSVATVTLHAVIDMNFIVPGFAADGTFRAGNSQEHPAGKGVSCATAACGLGIGSSTAAVVVCGHDDVDLYKETVMSAGCAAAYCLGGPKKTRRHVTVIDPSSQAGLKWQFQWQ
eukprot:gene14798-7961_t